MELYSYKLQELYGFTTDFFYDMGNEHDRVLFWGRFLFAFLGAFLGWLVFTQVRNHFGHFPAFLALAAFLFTPEVLAHAQWAHSDLASALTLFLVSVALARVFLQPSWRADVFLGLAMGIAVGTKLTALILWPMILILLAVFAKRGFYSFFRQVLLLLAVFYVVIVCVYLPEPRILPPHFFYAGDLTRIGIAWLEPLLRILPLPDTFLKGVIYTLLLGQHGQIAFFHGEVSSTGWWYYFPAAIFLKYPTGLLVVAVAGLVALWGGRFPVVYKVVFTFPPFVILGAAMIQSVDIGVRSVLPIAPFLALWCSAALWYWRSKITRSLILALLATSVVSGLAAYPNFLTYFNPLFGGTPSADKWLVDSNLDWGQDLPALAEELKLRNINEVRLAYFGGGRPSYYGIRALDADVVTTGWYAISRSSLSGWWPPGDPYGWLRSLRPVQLIGGSIALFYVNGEALSASLRTNGIATEESMMKVGLEALYDLHDYEKAVVQFREVLERNPRHYGATFQLAMALDGSGRRTEARLQWGKALRMAEKYHDKGIADIVRARLKSPP